MGPLVSGVKLLTTLVTLIFEPSPKVDILHLVLRVSLVVADLSTQIALKPSHVFPFSQLARVSTQVLLHSCIFPTVLQCSQVLHESKIND